MNFNIKEIDNDKIIRNCLYKVPKDYIVKCPEKHDDSGDDMVYLKFKSDNGIYGCEYRPQIIAKNGCKQADILAIAVDEENRKTNSYVMDIKRNITGFNISDDIDGIRKVAIKRIRDFIQQLEDSKKHKDSVIVYFDEYDNRENYGIITREFSVDKLNYAISELKKKLDIKEMNPLITAKMQQINIPIEKDIDMLGLFSDRKVKLFGKEYDLNIYLMRRKAESDDFEIEIEIEA